MEDDYANTIVLRELQQALIDLLDEKDCLTQGVRNVAQWCNSNHGLDWQLFRFFIGVF